MKKTLLIIGREYLSRVRKKSFILLTILVPLLFIGMYAVIFFLAFKGSNEVKYVRIIDESRVFLNRFKDSKTLKFSYPAASPEEEKEKIMDLDDTFLLHIRTAGNAAPPQAELISKKQAGIGTINQIEEQMEEVLRNKTLREAGIDTSVIGTLRTDVSLFTARITEKGEEKSSAGATYGVAFASCILIYMFIFIYGVQVMRGVIEEKTSRIVEVVISSVKPFQLMMGKIIGIALVGLTQFLLWILLTVTAAGIVSAAFMDEQPLPEMNAAGVSAPGTPAGVDADANFAQDILGALGTIDLPFILACFIFYFLGGYLLYSALFAAVGSAVDNETETQQFMLPVTIPLLFAYISSFGLIDSPDSPLLFWLSIIPFTSPVSMLVRLPFGVPGWQIALSAGLLVAGFLFTVWIASRIYRTGILMYGKKVTFRELGKWLFYKG